MRFLKQKHEIENYKEKSKFLKENGWEIWYHDDNWIKTEWVKQGKKYDMMGCSTDDVYNKLIKKKTYKITDNIMKKQLTVREWWDSLQPDEQQELFEKYYPDNNFGALAADENDINHLYEKEIIYEFIVTDTNNIKTRTFIPCKDVLEAIRIKELTLKSNGVINVEFKKK